MGRNRAVSSSPSATTHIDMAVFPAFWVILIPFPMGFIGLTSIPKATVERVITIGRTLKAVVDHDLWNLQAYI